MNIVVLQTKSLSQVYICDLLIWAREESGFSLKKAADKLGVEEDRLQQWEDGTERPSIPQLRSVIGFL